eukprot:TRINITY_DN49033_c0_g1_i1.p1 TRINITY_DN49033_c0_g1~~TRINITY_DN49033_c0_g1_i1.p1  ORF type:complete len:228 (-),score=35.79 TRINITY_DN49033_c0_g1_i1:525-1208(-)
MVDKSSAELIGDIVSGFFSKNVVEPITAAVSEDAPPPPVYREILKEQLTNGTQPNRRFALKNVKKADRKRMEAELMASAPSEPIPISRQRSQSDTDISPTSGSWGTPTWSVSPPEEFAEPLIGSISWERGQSPSPEIVNSTTEVSSRQRSRSRDCPGAETQIVRRRTKSKEERQAEEADLMREFRARDLSELLGETSGDENGVDTALGRQVQFVPYNPYVSKCSSSR